MAYSCDVMKTTTQRIAVLTAIALLAVPLVTFAQADNESAEGNCSDEMSEGEACGSAGSGTSNANSYASPSPSYTPSTQYSTTYPTYSPSTSYNPAPTYSSSPTPTYAYTTPTYNSTSDTGYSSSVGAGYSAPSYSVTNPSYASNIYTTPGTGYAATPTAYNITPTTGAPQQQQQQTYQQPMTPTYYQASGAYPNVSLRQIPYTGFDFGPVGDAIYWAALLAFAIAASYLLIYYRSGAFALATSLVHDGSMIRPVTFIDEKFEAKTVEESRVIQAAPTFINSRLASISNSTIAQAPRSMIDTMNIARSKNDEVRAS